MLAVEKSGSGIPLVFLHAFPLSKKMWDAHRPVFSKNFQFITVDFPGFGKSPMAGDITSMDGMADALNQALDKEGIHEKIILLGVSMGGYASFRFLSKFQERLRALALVATKATPDTEATKQKRSENIILIEREGLKPFAERQSMALLGRTTQTTQPNVARQVQEWIVEASPKAVCAALRGMAGRPDSSPILANLHIPTLVLSGEEDTVIPTDEMRQLAAQIKTSDFHPLSGVGHLVPIEKPVEFQNAFLTFLKRRVL